MIALPAIDLREGACVQLVGGSYQAERVRLPDPTAVAVRWRQAGFSALHVVDLDAATGRGDNLAVIGSLIAAFRGAGGSSVQVGGGMGNPGRIDAVLEAGADRVVVGTRAIEDSEWLAGTSESLPDRIVVAADVRDRTVVTRGWAGSSGRDILDVLAGLDRLSLAGVLITAVHVEGQLLGPDLALVRAAVAATRHPVQASGGIRDTGDLSALAEAGAEAAVIGMALYTGRLEAGTAAREFGQ